jgi:hypothetical protein
LRADGFIILAQAMIRTDGLFRPCKVLATAARSMQRLARCAREPRPNFSDTNHPKNLNAVSWVNRTQGESGKRSRITKNSLPTDRRLRADGFIILAQSMIRTDGRFFRPCKVLPFISP